MLAKLLLVLGSLLLLCRVGDGFIVSVDAHNEECFFENVEGGTKFGEQWERRGLARVSTDVAMLPLTGVTFEVIDGGFLDVDIKITGPDNHVMHESEKESSGKYTFVAPAKGTYTVCFNNERSSMTPKLVMFSIDVGEAPQRAPGAPGEEEVGHTKLEDMIRELSGTLTSVKHEQEYMHVSVPSPRLW